MLSGKFCKEQVNTGNHEQYKRGYQNDLCVEAVYLETKLMGVNIMPHEETDTADDDQGHNHQIYNHIS